jgi:hypothetical protein
MSKEIELNIVISKEGKVTVTPKGTVGSECLDILKFLDKIEGFEVKETVKMEDMKLNKNQDDEWINYLSTDYVGD